MLHKLPKLAFEILELLSHDKCMTQEQLEDILKADREAIKYAIRRLMENDIIIQTPNLMNMRSSRYCLADTDNLQAIKEQIMPELYVRIIETIEDSVKTIKVPSAAANA